MNILEKQRGRKRREHYVPRFILRGFTSDGNLSILNLQSQNKMFRTGIPESDFYEKDFYEFEITNGDRKLYFMPNSLENSYCNSEIKASKILAKVDNQGVNILKEEDQIALGTFAVMQTLRGPLFREVVSSQGDELLAKICVMLAKGETEMAMVFARCNGFSEQSDVFKIIRQNPVLKTLINDHIFDGISIGVAKSEEFHFIVGDFQALWYKNSPYLRFAFPFARDSLVFGYKGFSLVSSFFSFGTDLAGNFFRRYMISDFCDAINNEIIKKSIRVIACHPDDEAYVKNLIENSNHKSN